MRAPTWRASLALQVRAKYSVAWSSIYRTAPPPQGEASISMCRLLGGGSDGLTAKMSRQFGTGARRSAKPRILSSMRAP